MIVGREGGVMSEKGGEEDRPWPLSAYYMELLGATEFLHARNAGGSRPHGLSPRTRHRDVATI